MCNNTSSLVTLGHIGKITMYITRSACNTEMIFNILAPTFYCTCMIKKMVVSTREEGRVTTHRA